MEYVETDRVAQHTNPKVNKKIEFDLEKSILFYSHHPADVNTRLSELEREWDIERLLEANASALILLTTLIGLAGSRKYLLLTLAVAGFLLQHAIQGWCPPIEVFRRLGVRTKNEIEKERNALRALRGDFDPLASVDKDFSKRGEAVLSIVTERV